MIIHQVPTHSLAFLNVTDQMSHPQLQQYYENKHMFYGMKYPL